MKGDKKLLVIAALILLITVCYTTYAIYKTSVDVTGEVTAAKWVVAFKDGSSSISTGTTITFGAGECKNNAHVKDGVIAPGASCTKKIILDASTTEVDVVYSASVGAVTASGTSTAGANAFSASLTPTTGTISYSSGSQTVELSLVVSWAGTDDSEANPSDVINNADTGLQGVTISVPVTLVAKQQVG